MKHYSRKRKHTYLRQGFNNNGILTFCKAKYGNSYRRWKHRNTQD